MVSVELAIGGASLSAQLILEQVAAKAHFPPLPSKCACRSIGHKGLEAVT